MSLKQVESPHPLPRRYPELTLHFFFFFTEKCPSGKILTGSAGIFLHLTLDPAGWHRRVLREAA